MRQYFEAPHRDYRTKLKTWASPGLRGSAVMFEVRLSQRGPEPAFTEMAGRTARNNDEDGGFTHDGSAASRVHVHNTRRRPSQWV